MFTWLTDLTKTTADVGTYGIGLQLSQTGQSLSKNWKKKLANSEVTVSDRLHKDIHEIYFDMVQLVVDSGSCSEPAAQWWRLQWSHWRPSRPLFFGNGHHSTSSKIRGHRRHLILRVTMWGYHRRPFPFKLDLDMLRQGSMLWYRAFIPAGYKWLRIQRHNTTMDIHDIHV